MVSPVLTLSLETVEDDGVFRHPYLVPRDFDRVGDQDGLPLPESLNLSHIWTHPGLQGQFRVTACRITTARIYTACHVRTRVPPGLDGFRALPPQQFDDL